MRGVRFALAIVAVALLSWIAARNWVPVTLDLGGDWAVDIMLPLLIALAVLLGWLPPAIQLAASRLSWRRRHARADARIATLESELAARLTPAPTPPPPVMLVKDPVPHSTPPAN